MLLQTDLRTFPSLMRHRFIGLSLLFFLVVCAVPIGFSQASPAAKVADPTGIVKFLSSTINWYRGLAQQQEIATDASDLPYLADNRRVADQVVQLAFEFARQQEDALAKQGKTTASQAQSGEDAQYQHLNEMAQSADSQVQQIQSEIETLHQKVQAAGIRRRQQLDAQLAETQSELALAQARRDVLHNMLDFANGTSASGLGASGLRAQIEELARSVPSAFSQSSGQSAAPGSAATAAPHATPGILALASDIFKLSGKIRALQAEIDATDALGQESRQVRAPLVDNLKQLIANGNQLTVQADTSGTTALDQQKKQLDLLTASFKQASASLMPLSKQAVLLNLYKRTLTNWQDSIRHQYHNDWRSLLIRLTVLLVIVAAVLAFGEIWRKAILRYVHDSWRRYQLLLIHKIVVWVTVAIIIALTFATELGSVATFAGLLTAGVAVALQNVILSMVGYFFLIGKYGLRVGDRVEVAGVKGEVVDIGLVRLHLLEFGSGSDTQPSGRVVAFSNSIVFQPTAGLFKQIPGANFAWHEIALTFAPDSEYHIVKQRVQNAVDSAFSKYRDNIEQQKQHMEASVNSMASIDLRPRIRVHYTATGIESVVRFPVEGKTASEIDDQIMHQLLAEINREPELRLVGAIPQLRTEVPVGASK
jgi:Mechanosensitive ion channel, beta-domain